MKRSRIIIALALVGYLTPISRAQEDVVYRLKGIVDRGTIVSRDETGIRMIRTGAKQEILIPADQIERVDVKTTAQQEEAERLLEEGDYRGSALKFEEALKAESRRWLRTQIASSLVACYVSAGDSVAAIQAFFRASQMADGQINVSAVPLWWLPESPPSVGVQFAGRLVQSNNPLEQVIGASFLFGTSQAAEGREALAKLTTYGDERIGQLARTQLWRWEAATAKPGEVASWQRQVTRFPADARGGPYFAIALALRQLGQHEEAARAFLWPALVYRNDPNLSCRALLLAAQSLEQAGQAAEAKQLYGELTVRFASKPEASTAQARLNAIKE